MSTRHSTRRARPFKVIGNGEGGEWGREVTKGRANGVGKGATKWGGERGWPCPLRVESFMASFIGHLLEGRAGSVCEEEGA